MTAPIVELRGVTRSYGSPPTVALNSVDLTIDEGELLAIVGPSGSGKSTMLNIIGNVMIQYTNEEYNDGARKQGVIKTNTPGGNGSQGGSNNTPKPDIVQDLDDLVL